MQDVDTSFGTAHEVTKRFRKEFVQVGDIIAGKNEAPEAYHAIFLLRCSQLPTLKAIRDLLGSIKHIQTAMEAKNEPTMQKLLVVLVQLKCQIDY